MRLIHIVIACAASAGFSCASADELLLSGHVQKITQLAAGTPSCPRLSGAHTGADGGQRIAVSNDCGCEVTDIKIDHVYLGRHADGVLQVSDRVGEWCRPAFEIAAGTILVWRDQDRARWSALDAENGKTLFAVKPFQTIAGVAVATLPQDERGRATLDDLLAKLAH